MGNTKKWGEKTRSTTSDIEDKKTTDLTIADVLTDLQACLNTLWSPVGAKRQPGRP